MTVTDASLRSNDDSLRTNAIADAEIEAAIERYGETAIWLDYAESKNGDPSFDHVIPEARDDADAARANLLRLIAAQRSAARREALEDALRAIDADIPDEQDGGVALMLAEAGAKRARFIVSSLLTKEDSDVQ